METQHIEVDRKEALRLYRKYKEHKAYSTPIDNEIRRTYQLISQGRLIIKALESIKEAGLNAEGLPKLAIATANATSVECRIWATGAMRLDSRKSQTWKNHGQDAYITERAYFHWPRDSFKSQREYWRNASALVPGVPLDLRPKRGLANYHILFEAVWSKIVPYDPMLLRRIGKSDLWIVVASWDLTEVERGALATRVK